MKKRIVSILLLVAIFMFPLTVQAETNFSTNPVAINDAAKSVLMLEVFDADNELIATGSGFVAFNNRTIVTNYHVIEGADWMMANSDDGYQYMVTKVLVSDEEKDIAICSFMSPTDLKPLVFNADGELLRAESIVAIGSPEGFTNTVSLGNISALFKDDYASWIQFTAPISHGSSGGALFDDNGRVIGVTSASYMENNAQNINFAVHISEVEALYENWNGEESFFAEYRIDKNATPEPQLTPEPLITAKPTEEIPLFLKLGDSGAAVVHLQEKLIELGYMDGVATGIFDEDTRSAVILFNQQNFGINSTSATIGMMTLLFKGNPEPYIEPTPTPIPTITAKPTEEIPLLLKLGDSGAAVVRLQEKLIELGYMDGVATGIFDEDTKSAVILFKQINFGVKSSTATIGMMTLLFNGNPEPYIKPTVTPIPYPKLQEGDRGEGVKKIQRRLIELGYLDGSADGIWGKKTSEAVIEFYKQNKAKLHEMQLIYGDLPEVGINNYTATNAMQQFLFHGNPSKFKDVDKALYIKDGAYAEWYDLSGDKLQIHFQVTNQAKKKTVKAFELSVYAKDIWGNKIYGSNTYKWTTTKTVSPGKTVYSDYITIPDRSDIAEVCCGINKIAYTDGTFYTYPSVYYSSWSIY